jgi:hypothetical protein
VGVTVSTRKIKYMAVTKNPTDTKMLKIQEQEYERIEEFEYLGTILTEDNDVTTEINQRIIMANKTSYGLK